MMRKLAVPLLLSAALGACSEINIEAGRLPDNSVLESGLRIGQSSMADVRQMLGEPVGHGNVALPVLDPGHRETWTYYYERGLINTGGETVGFDDRREFLFVFFDDGRYDGYIWFSSLPKSQTNRAN